MRVFRIDGPHGLDGSPVAVAVGTFDGVHLGHRALISRLVELARADGQQAGVLVPDPHPLAVLRPAAAPPVLTPLSRKVELMEAEGVQWVAIMPFDRAWAEMPAEEFARGTLSSYLAARRVVAGYNFTFGRGGEGTGGSLRAMGPKLGFQVEVISPVQMDGHPVSSSRIRDALDVGDVSLAARLLGRPHRVEGRVVPGDGRGRRIGIPTANLHPPEGVARPGRGVYAVMVDVSGERVAGVANIGLRPTFGGGGRERIEVHLITGGRDLYGRDMAVEFLGRIRDEIAFSGADELRSQVRDDVIRARALCGERDLW